MAVGLVDPGGVAVAERAPAAVLAGQANSPAFLEQGSEGERLGGRPVEALAAGEHLGLGVDDPLEGLVDGQPFRDRGQHLADLAQARLFDAGGDVAAFGLRSLRPAEARPAALEPVGLVGKIGFGRLELGLEQGGELADPGLGPGRIDHAFLPEARAVQLGDRRVLADLGIHERLGEARLVALVMAEAAVAPHVDDDVAGEFLAIFDGELAGEGHRLRIVAVDVEDRRLDRLGDVRRIR